MNNIPPQDLRVLIHAARCASFAAAAEDLGSSPAYISKRIAMLEEALGAKLFLRTTRRVALTERGELILGAQRVLDTYDQVDGALEEIRPDYRGPCASPQAPASAAITSRRYLGSGQDSSGARNRSEDRRSLGGPRGGGDRHRCAFGDIHEPHLVPHHLAHGRRIVCAAPAYIRRRGEPATPADLGRHSCLLIRERNETFGRWSLQGPDGTRNVRVKGSLASNHGDVVRQWALAGHGIMLRSYWDVAENLKRGELFMSAGLLAARGHLGRDQDTLREFQPDPACIRHLGARLRTGPYALEAPG